MGKLTKEEINDRFYARSLNREGHLKMDAIKTALKDAAQVINDECPPSRETSSALTRLEEAMFHAIAAVERDSANWPKSYF